MPGLAAVCRIDVFSDSALADRPAVKLNFVIRCSRTLPRSNRKLSCIYHRSIDISNGKVVARIISSWINVLTRTVPASVIRENVVGLHILSVCKILHMTYTN